MTVVCELVTDRNGLITRASPETAALFGIDQRWLMRKPLASFVAGPDRQRFRTLLVDLGYGRRPNGRSAFLLESRNGVEIAAQLTATMDHDALTWHLAAEADPPAAEAPPPVRDPDADRLFERVLNRLPNGVVLVDRRLVVVFVNPAARRLMGGDDMVRTGKPIPDPWVDLSLPSLAESLFTSSPRAGTHLVAAGDRTICVEGLVARQATTATLLLDDVTEREQRRAAERTFVENAAHELRTPLAAIVSVVDVLESGAINDATARDRFLAHIRANSSRLVRLTTSLLSLARIQSGRQQPRLDLVEVRPLLTSVVEGLPVSAAGVRIDVRAPDRIAALADPDLLYQAIENVALNAQKHTREGEVVLEARDLGRNVEIELRDTGSGMSKSDVDQAFDRFYRAPTADGDGFGLGLAIAEAAVRVLGGTITLDSTPRVGTRVRIRVPSSRIVS
jgi:signal transduction histidine kinase